MESIIDRNRTALVAGYHLDTWMIWSARTLSSEGIEVILATTLQPTSNGDHNDNLKYILAASQPYRIIDIHRYRPQGISTFIVSCVGPIPKWFRKWTQIAANRSGVSVAILRGLPNGRKWWLRQLAKESWSPFLRLFDAGLSEDLELSWLPLRLGRKWSMSGIPPHTKYLTTDSTGYGLFSPPPDLSTIHSLLAFQGASKGPPIRTRILVAVKSWAISQGLNLIARAADAEGSNSVVWYESDEMPSRSDDEYIKCTDASAFSLCPPGYVGFTHRVVESALRGSIPILPASEADRYGFGLVDGINCLLVRDDDGSPEHAWTRSVDRARAMPLGEVFQMRSQVLTSARNWWGDGSFKALMKQIGAN